MVLLSSNRVKNLVGQYIPLTDGETLSINVEGSTKIVHKYDNVIISGRCVNEGPYYNRRIRLYYSKVPKSRRGLFHKCVNDNSLEPMDRFNYLQENYPVVKNEVSNCKYEAEPL